MTKKCEYCGVDLFWEIPKTPEEGRIYKYHKECYNAVRLEIPSDVGVEILEHLNHVKYETPSGIVVATGRSKSAVEKQLRKMLELGYIKRKRVKYASHYSILAKGKIYLTKN